MEWEDSQSFWEQLVWEQKSILMTDYKLDFNVKQMVSAVAASAISQTGSWPYK